MQLIIYRAMINVPGYLPMDDEDHLFDTAREAWEWLYDQRERDLDDPMNDIDDTYEDQCLDEIMDYVDDPDTGVVYGRTLGYDGDHDLGLAYSVVEVKHADYPHEPGRLYDCPACEAIMECRADIELDR